MRNFNLLLNSIRLVPHILAFKYHKNNPIIRYDTERWMQVLKINSNIQMGFIELMSTLPEYRNLFYKRMGGHFYLINWLCPKMDSLSIYTDKMGPGLVIRHGTSTLIGAKSIGKNCTIYQQVSIAYIDDKSPIIGDNVIIYCGAILIGDIKIGNNSVIGAGAVVIKDVPENSVVVGVPGHVIHENRDAI